MSLKNLSSQRNNSKKIGTEFSRDFYKGSFENKDKIFLNDSEFIENYNDALKSPQSRRLYKNIDNEIHQDSIAVQEILPIDKISI